MNNEFLCHQFGLADLISLALNLQNTLEREPEMARVAVAWTFRNRWESGRGAIAIKDAFEAELPASNSGIYYTRPFLAALGTISLVFSDAVPDPTSGSTRYHRHDENPHWAQGQNPNALLGSFFFYLA